MADFSGIGAFGEGALKGYDTGLSRYATIEEMRQRRDAAQRAAQAQALQTLIHGAQLATTQPEIAEAAIQNPAYGLEAGPVQAGVARARALQGAAQRFAHAVQTGDFDENDMEIGRFVATDPAKYAPLLKEALDKKDLKRIMSDPNMTPQQRAQAIQSRGIKVDLGLLDRAYPGLVGGMEAEKAAGGLRGGMLPGPGGQPLVGETEAAKVGGGMRGRMAPAPTLPAGQQSLAEAEAQAQATGRVTGENVAELSPFPKTDIRQAPARLKAEARETPAQKAWLEQRTEREKEKPVISEDEKAKIILGKLQTQGYYYDPSTQRVWGPQDMPGLAQRAGREGRKINPPREINGVLVFNPRSFSQNMSAQDRLQLAQEQTRQWLGKDAITGADEQGLPIRERITKKHMLDFYKRQLGAPTP
jgi:hypothetical protein